MSEREEGQLKATEIYRLLDHLSIYMGSSHAMVEEKKGSAPDSAGNYVQLDGEAFLTGFAEYLQAFELDQEKFLGELSLVMEISTYVRNGGIKAILYRLETGGWNITQDYFDVLSRQLCMKWQDGKFTDVCGEANTNLISRLRQINLEDEARVAAAISEIDQILLELRAMLEARSEENLAKVEKKDD